MRACSVTSGIATSPGVQLRIRPIRLRAVNRCEGCEWCNRCERRDRCNRCNGHCRRSVRVGWGIDAMRVKVMARRSGNGRDEELARLRSWCLAIVQFMARLSPSNVLGDTEDVINSAFERRDLRGLRMICRDVREWTKGLSAADAIRLEHALRSSFGVGLIETSNKEKGAVSQSLERGKIDGEEEYRILTEIPAGTIAHIVKLHRTDPAKPHCTDHRRLIALTSEARSHLLTKRL
jgi:hypothetical protein